MNNSAIESLRIQMKVNNNKMLSCKEAAVYLGIKPQTLRGYIKKRSVPHYKGVRKLQFLPSELNEWKKGQTEKVRTESELLEAALTEANQFNQKRRK
jgi:excisionase family DNA binding protein